MLGFTAVGLGFDENIQSVLLNSSNPNYCSSLLGVYYCSRNATHLIQMCGFSTVATVPGTVSAVVRVCWKYSKLFWIFKPYCSTIWVSCCCSRNATLLYTNVWAFYCGSSVSCSSLQYIKNLLNFWQVIVILHCMRNYIFISTVRHCNAVLYAVEMPHIWIQMCGSFTAVEVSTYVLAAVEFWLDTLKFYKCFTL